MKEFDFHLKPKAGRMARDLAQQIVDGVLEFGVCDIELPDELKLDIVRTEDSVEINWSDNPTIDLPGPNADMLRAEVFEDHARVELRAYGFTGALKVWF